MRRLRFLSVIALVLAFGCNAILGIDAPNTVTPGAEAGGPESGGPESGASDSSGVDSGADADAGAQDAWSVDGNLLTNGGFENNCNGWDTTDGLSSSGPDPLALSGATSCRVCGMAALAQWSIGQDVPTSMLVQGKSYVVTGYYRAAPQSAPAGATYLELGVEGTPDVTSLRIADQTPSDWTMMRASIQYDDDSGAPTFFVSVRVRDTGGGCFLVDDFSLVEQ